MTSRRLTIRRLRWQMLVQYGAVVGTVRQRHPDPDYCFVHNFRWTSPHLEQIQHFQPHLMRVEAMAAVREGEVVAVAMPPKPSFHPYTARYL